MKNLKQNIFSGVTIALSFFFTLGIIYITYGALTNLPSKVGTGSGLTANSWNKVVDSLTELDSKSVPSGAVMAFNLSECPTGWLTANGSNGTPELRGEFIRGWIKDRSGFETGRLLNTFQNATRVFSQMTDDGGWNGRQVDVSGFIASDYDGSQELAVDRATSYASLATSAGLIPNQKGRGVRVRPRNVALLYCMKQ